MWYRYSISSLLQVLTELQQHKKGKNIAEKERLHTETGLPAFAIAQNADF